MKHMALRWRFLKQAINEGITTVKKTHTSENPADVLTKILNKNRMKECIERVPGFHIEEDCGSINMLESQSLGNSVPDAQNFRRARGSQTILGIIVRMHVTIFRVWMYSGHALCAEIHRCGQEPRG